MSEADQIRSWALSMAACARESLHWWTEAKRVTCQQDRQTSLHLADVLRHEVHRLAWALRNAKQSRRPEVICEPF